MGFPKAQWLKNSNLPACRNAGHPTPQNFMLSIEAAGSVFGNQSSQRPD
jgi:hypothetical protein